MFVKGLQVYHAYLQYNGSLLEMDITNYTQAIQLTKDKSRKRIITGSQWLQKLEYMCVNNYIIYLASYVCVLGVDAV